MKIKIFGERNTSTNALRKLILLNSSSHVYPGTMEEIDRAATQKRNFLRKIRAPIEFIEAVYDDVFDGRPPTEQWKHAATCFDAVDDFYGTHVIFTVRKPMSWLLALYKNPYHALSRVPRSFAEFVDCDWRTLRRDRLGEIRLAPVALYEEKIRSYMDLVGKLERSGVSFSILKFEDLILDQKGSFEKIAPYLDRPAAEFAALTESTKTKDLDIRHYMKYYGEERWKDEIDKAVLGRVVFDGTLTQWLGYD
jgi:hypothetical protein